MEKPRILVAQDLLTFILEETAKAKQARIAVAFARQSGLVLMERQIQTSLEKGGKWDFLVGLDFSQTEGAVLRRLLKWKSNFTHFDFGCYSDPSIDRAKTFHPKVFMFQRGGRACAVVGSSNLTGGGLGGNEEANIVVQGSADEIDDMGFPALFARWKYQGTCFTPDEVYIERYEFVRRRVVKMSRRVLAKPSTKGELEKLRKRESELAIEPRDPATLKGQQKWIYERLPEGEFSTPDMYAHVKEFQTRSRTPEASIRRLLQEVRDEGILIHLGKNRWNRRV